MSHHHRVSITPLVHHGLRELQLGLPIDHVLREVALMGVLVGAGMSPAKAIRSVEKAEPALLGLRPGEEREGFHGGMMPGGMMPGGMMPGAPMPGGMMPGAPMPGGMMPGGMMPGGMMPGGMMPGGMMPGGMMPGGMMPGGMMPGGMMPGGMGPGVTMGPGPTVHIYPGTADWW
jgi:hypothetical protein